MAPVPVPVPTGAAALLTHKQIEMTTSGGPNTSKQSYLSIFSHVQWQHLAAGISGGVISTVAVHPLDLIKVRFQGLFLFQTLKYFLYIEQR